MTATVQSFSAELDLDIEKYLGNLREALDQTEAGLGKLKSDIQAASSDLSDVWVQQTDGMTMAMDSMVAVATVGFGRIVSVIAAMFTVDWASGAAEGWSKAALSLRGLSVAVEGAAADLGTLEAIAVTHGQAIEGVADYYRKLAASQHLVGTSSGEITLFVDGTIGAFRAMGKSLSDSGTETNALVQIMRSGKASIGEFNTLLDGSPQILQAVAAGLVEAGGDVDKLRGLVDDGKISAETFLQAFLSGRSAIAELTPETSGLSEGVTALRTEFGHLINSIVELVDGGGSLFGWMKDVARGLGAIADELDRINGAKSVPAPNIVSGGGLTTNFDTGVVRDEATGKIVENLYGPVGDDQGRAQVSVPLPKERPEAPSRTPISWRDHPVADDGKSGSGSDENDYDRATKSLEDRIEKLKLEQDTLGETTIERERAKAQLDLENAAEKAGIPITDELRQKNADLADAYAIQVDATERAKEAQKAQNELQLELGRSLTSYFSDIVSGGKNAEQALTNLTKRLADMALEAVLIGQGPLASILGLKGESGAVGGLFGALFKSLGLFDTGGWTGGSNPSSISGFVHEREFVVRAGPAEKYLPLLQAINAGLPAYAVGGFVGATPSFDRWNAATGGDREADLRPIRVAMTVQSPDAAGFRKSQTQIAAGLTKALRRGQRGL